MKLSTVVKAQAEAEKPGYWMTRVDDLGRLAPVVPPMTEPAVSPFTFRSSGIAERYEDGSAWGGFQDSWGTGK